VIKVLVAKGGKSRK